MTRRRVAWLAVVAALAGCGGAAGGNGVVIPYENGRLVATTSARDEQDALKDALAAARHECEGRHQPLAVVKQKTEYKGVVAREIVRSAKQIEEIIAAGGSAVIPDLSTDEDYKVSLEFRCGA